MDITAARANISVVPTDDGKAWQIQLAWDNGRQDRLLRFESREEADAWVKWDGLGCLASRQMRRAWQLAAQQWASRKIGRERP